MSHRIKRWIKWAEKRARRRREEQERRGEKRAEVSQTGPLTRDTRRAYKVYDNTTLRKEKERPGLCPVFVHETRSERWTIAPSFPSKRASAISIRRNYTWLSKLSSRVHPYLQFRQRVREWEQVAPSLPIGKSMTRLSEREIKDLSRKVVFVLIWEIKDIDLSFRSPNVPRSESEIRVRFYTRARILLF